MNLSPERLATLHAILNDDSNSFVRLGEIAGFNPATTYVGADLADVDFGTDDLAGHDFTRADLSRCNFSQAKNVDKVILTDAITTDVIWGDWGDLSA